MKTFVLLAVLISSAPAFARDTYVKGYTRTDGTYVQPHYRTGADNTTSNNYSTKGNVNPYTGAPGTKNVYDTNSSSNTSGHSYYDND